MMRFLSFLAVSFLFLCFADALHIQCTFSVDSTKYFTYAYSYSYYYICEDTTINITSKSEDRAVISTAGDHIYSSGQGRTLTNAYIEVYAVNNKTLNYLPTGLVNHFSALKVLWINNCGLKEITKEELRFSSLYALNVDDNEIEVLYGDLFINAVSLYSASFKNNRIKEVHYGVFLVPTSPTMYYLFMSNNPCNENDTATSSVATVKAYALTIYENCNPLKIQDEKREKFESEMKRINDENFKCAEHFAPFSSLYVQESKQRKSCEKSLKKLFNNQKFYQCNMQKNELRDLQNFKRNMLNFDLICELSGEKNQTCNVQNLKVIDPETELRVVKYNYCDELITAPLTNISIYKQKCSYIPHKLSQRFAQAKILSIINSGLLQLKSTDFEAFLKLEKLYLSNNKLSMIEGEVFDSNLKTIKILDLSRNNIEYIEENAFFNLVNLQEIKLNHNALGTISSNFLAKNRNLVRVFLQGNHLTEISAQMLYHMGKINFADFRNNKCINIAMPEETITADIITKCSAPVVVECEYKLIDGIYACVASLTVENENINLEKIVGEHKANYQDEDVKMLQIENQIVNFIPSQGLSKYFPNIKTLVIKNSELTKIRNEDFEEFSKLEKLVISGNNLQVIQENSFNDINLKELDLSSNNIQELPSNIFAKLLKLQILKLDDNKISKLEKDAIPCTKTLKQFSIIKNILEDVDSRIWKCFANPCKIDFSKNKCVDAKVDKPDELNNILKNC